MTTVRDIIKRDIGVKIEGVVKVFDRASLATEIREYVVTDKIEEELKKIFDTFTHIGEILRRGGPARDVMGIWISGFFGSGKSHFAKVLGHILQNTSLDDTAKERCIDTFVKHLSDTPRGRDIKLRLGEVKLNTEIRTIPFEIKSRQSLNNPNSVGEILLSEFYRNIGLAENFVVARIERRLQQNKLLEKLEAEYLKAVGIPWRSAEGREDLMTVRRRLAQVLPKVAPSDYPDEKTAKHALGDMFRHEKITAEGIADELVAWVDAQKTRGGKTLHLVFVIDEMGTFIGDSNERISELNALAVIIPNVFPRFAMADRQYDFGKQLNALLNPATSALYAVAQALDLFDTQGSLQQESALVSQMLEVVRDIEDEGIDPVGAMLLDAKDRKGFKGFCRPPFGWPDELVRLVLAACFRAGAIYIERQTGAGPAPIYDFKGSNDFFSKITTFKKMTFRVAETSLSVEQIKEAGKALVALGVNGIPESGNAIAAAIRELGTKLKSGLGEARLHLQQGLPIPDEVLGAENALSEPMTAKDPTKAVTAFLAVQDQWKALHRGIESLRGFLDSNRHHDFGASRKLIMLAEAHPIPDSLARAKEMTQALKDMAAVIAAKEVISRWSDYRDAFERASKAYQDTYLEAYEKVRSETDETVASIKNGDAYRDAPSEKRDQTVERVFGEGKVCSYPAISLSAVGSLLDAAAKNSLTSLGQALVALPGYRAQVEAELRELSAPPPVADEKVYEWRPVNLLGRRFKTEADVDDAVEAIADELKTHIRDGYTIVVK
jgi:hypothetical protein